MELRGRMANCLTPFIASDLPSKPNHVACFSSALVPTGDNKAEAAEPTGPAHKHIASRPSVEIHSPRGIADPDEQKRFPVAAVAEVRHERTPEHGQRLTSACLPKVPYKKTFSLFYFLPLAVVGALRFPVVMPFTSLLQHLVVSLFLLLREPRFDFVPAVLAKSQHFLVTVLR